MNVSASEIERIVRDVLASMTHRDAVPVATRSVPADDVYALATSLVSMDTLKAVPAGIQSVQVARRAVVTPAALDRCRERGIRIVRSESPGVAIAAGNAAVSAVAKAPLESRPKRLFVSGSVAWLPVLGKQLCSKRSQMDEVQPDDASVVRSVAAAIRRGHASCLAVVAAPHAALWQAARDEALRPAVVSQWSDVNDILREVPTNVLLVSSQKWNVAGVANIARRFLEHQHTQS